MKHRLIFRGLLLMLIMLDSCENKQEIPTQDQITEIVLETIKQNSLDHNIPVCLNIMDRYIYQPVYDREFGYIPTPPRDRNGAPFIFSQYKSTNNDLLGFIPNDSLFVARQIKSNKHMTLDLKLLPKEIKVVNISYDNRKGDGFYIFILPIFNKRKDLAIVEYDIKCAGCARGKIVYFRRIEKKWIKMESFTTWRE